MESYDTYLHNTQDSLPLWIDKTKRSENGSIETSKAFHDVIHRFKSRLSEEMQRVGSFIPSRIEIRYYSQSHEFLVEFPHIYHPHSPSKRFEDKLYFDSIRFCAGESIPDVYRERIPNFFVDALEILTSISEPPKRTLHTKIISGYVHHAQIRTPPMRNIIRIFSPKSVSQIRTRATLEL